MNFGANQPMGRRMSEEEAERQRQTQGANQLTGRRLTEEEALYERQRRTQPMLPATTMIPLSVYHHDNRFLRYNIYGNIVEITTKYKPPILPIGRGSYGLVYSALNSETNEMVAIKKIANTFCSKIDAKRTLREIKILRHMNHDNIIAMKDIIPPPERNSFNDVYIVYEFMDTDLNQIIKSNQKLTDEHIQYFLYQILRGLKYLHSADVLHRDLKPSNILLNINCDLKICDFGLARLKSESPVMTGYVVTRAYRPPELLLQSSYYDGAVDMWSVGCIFMEMLTLNPLFAARDIPHQLRLILQLLGTPTEAEMACLTNEDAKRYLRQLPFYPRRPIGSYFPKINSLAMDLVQKMLTFDPRRRIKVEQALAHPYLAFLHDIKDEPVCMAPINYGYSSDTLTQVQAKDIVYMEAIRYNPQHYQRNF